MATRQDWINFGSSAFRRETGQMPEVAATDKAFESSKGHQGTSVPKGVVEDWPALESFPSTELRDDQNEWESMSFNPFRVIIASKDSTGGGSGEAHFWNDAKDPVMNPAGCFLPRKKQDAPSNAGPRSNSKYESLVRDWQEKSSRFMEDPLTVFRADELLDTDMSTFVLLPSFRTEDSGRAQKQSNENGRKGKNKRDSQRNEPENLHEADDGLVGLLDDVIHWTWDALAENEAETSIKTKKKKKQKTRKSKEKQTRRRKVSRTPLQCYQRRTLEQGALTKSVSSPPEVEATAAFRPNRSPVKRTVSDDEDGTLFGEEDDIIIHDYTSFPMKNEELKSCGNWKEALVGGSCSCSPDTDPENYALDRITSALSIDSMSRSKRERMLGSKIRKALSYPASTPSDMESVASGSSLGETAPKAERDDQLRRKKFNKEDIREDPSASESLLDIEVEHGAESYCISAREALMLEKACAQSTAQVFDASTRAAYEFHGAQKTFDLENIQGYIEYIGKEIPSGCAPSTLLTQMEGLFENVSKITRCGEAADGDVSIAVSTEPGIEIFEGRATPLAVLSPTEIRDEENGTSRKTSTAKAAQRASS